MSHFNEPDEKIAARMGITEARTERRLLKQEYQRVDMSEFPEGFFTISAYGPKPELRVINPLRKIAA